MAVRRWVRQAEIDARIAPGVTSAEAEEVARLRKQPAGGDLGARHPGPGCGCQQNRRSGSTLAWPTTTVGCWGA